MHPLRRIAESLARSQARLRHESAPLPAAAPLIGRIQLLTPLLPGVPAQAKLLAAQPAAQDPYNCRTRLCITVHDPTRSIAAPQGTRGWAIKTYDVPGGGRWEVLSIQQAHYPVQFQGPAYIHAAPSEGNDQNELTETDGLTARFTTTIGDPAEAGLENLADDCTDFGDPCLEATVPGRFLIHWQAAFYRGNDWPTNVYESRQTSTDSGHSHSYDRYEKDWLPVQANIYRRPEGGNWSHLAALELSGYVHAWSQSDAPWRAGAMAIVELQAGDQLKVLLSVPTNHLPSTAGVKVDALILVASWLCPPAE